MDSHPETDLDARMSNPEEEEDRMEDQYESGDEEEQGDFDENEEDPSGVNAPPTMSRHDSPITDFFQHQIEERKRLERELLAQKELMIKREEPPPYLGGGSAHNGGSSSKSATPSPTSPSQMQYLYAANHQFAAANHQLAAAAAAAAFLSPSHLAAAAAAAQSAAVAAAAQAASGGHHAGALTPTGGNGGSSTGSATPTNAVEDQSKYTFEEQFKQASPTSDLKRRSNSKFQGAVPDKLYEISDDPRRKEFLDDLFNFMQKRGTPVNRVPIMAKQVLDLYELYRLVVARGGLVEVINKKIWREITKGLNLPSSITSAAFTLRTQYMRYLYPYECDREKLSTAEELQAAIDGNRREGRRSSYGPYGDMVGQAMVPVSKNSPHQPLSSPLSLVSRHVNGHGSTPHGGLSSGRGSASPLPLAYFHNNSTPAPLPLNLAHQENGIYGSHGLSSGTWKTIKKEEPSNPSNSPFRIGYGYAEEDNCNSISSTPNPMVMPQQEALNLEVSRNSTNVDQKPLNMKRKPHEEEENLMREKRQLIIEEERLLSRSSMPSTHIKITSNRGLDGRTQSDGSLMVSMEVNGIMYQGVLFAAPNHRNRL